MAEDIDFVYRDYNTPGDPGSGESKPDKLRIRRLLKEIRGGTSAVGDYRGAWLVGSDYIATDLVEYGGSIWYALAGSTGVSPTEGATWTLFLPGGSPSAGTVTEPMLADSLTLTLSAPVDDRTAMKAIDTSRYNIALMAGRIFYWNGADLSTEVTGDPGEGIYVAPTDGSTGAWVAAEYTGGGYMLDWWSPVGDGATDDVTVITNAMTAVAASGGGDLILSKIHAYATHLFVPDNVNLVSYVGGGFIATGTGHIRMGVNSQLRNLEIDFNGTSRSILVEGKDDVLIEGCHIFDTTGNGIHGQSGSKRLRVHGCHIHDIGLTGFYSQGTTSVSNDDNEAIRNRIYNCGRSGIVIAGTGARTSPASTQNLAKNPRFEGNTVTDVGSTGVEPNCIGFPYTDGAQIHRNTCLRSSEHGIAGQESYRFNATGNICRENPYGGFSVQSGFGSAFNPSTEGTVTGNTFTDNDYGAIFRDKCTNIRFNANYILGNSTGPVRLFGSDGVSDNIKGVGNFPAGSITAENASTNISIT